MKFAEGYPKVLRRRYRDDNLLSLSDRQRGGTVAGYGIAELRADSPEEEKQLREQGFSDGSDGAGATRYPLVLELSAITGGAPAQRFTVYGNQEYANVCGQAWEDGRKVTVVSQEETKVSAQRS